MMCCIPFVCNTRFIDDCQPPTTCSQFGLKPSKLVKKQWGGKTQGEIEKGIKWVFILEIWRQYDRKWKERVANWFVQGEFIFWMGNPGICLLNNNIIYWLNISRLLPMVLWITKSASIDLFILGPIGLSRVGSQPPLSMVLAILSIKIFLFIINCLSKFVETQRSQILMHSS